MKHKFNISRVAAGVATISLLIPQTFVFAAASTSPGAANNFCTNFSTLAAQVSAKIPQRQDARTQNLDTRSAKIDERLAKRTIKLDDKRDTADQKLQRKYARLEAAATTTEQKAAVQAFRATTTAAIVARRNAVDAAVTAFQNGVDELLMSRNVQLEAAFATLSASTAAAISSAQTACVSGTAPKTARTNFISSLKAANAAFRTAIKPSEIGTKVAALRTTRDASVKTAMDTFKNVSQQATVALKTTFGK